MKKAMAIIGKLAILRKKLSTRVLLTLLSKRGLWRMTSLYEELNRPEA